MNNKMSSSPDFQTKSLLGTLLFILGVCSLFVSNAYLLPLCIAAVIIFSVFLINRYYTKTEDKSRNSEIAKRSRRASRYEIPVEVAYSSDSNLATYLILKAANEHELVLENPAATVKFADFRNASLGFNLYFYCKEDKNVEEVKSDLRNRIMELFQAHNVEILFPKRDLWLRTSNTNLQGLSTLGSV